MITKTKINMDLQEKGITPRIDVVQGDFNTRALELLLYAQGRKWEIPADVTARLRYRKPDGTGGVYDTLPDGTRAWQIEGNAVTLMLAPQMLSAAGRVLAQAELISGADNLATFEIQLDVTPNIAAGVLKSENYINMHAWLLEGLDTALEQAVKDGSFVPAISMGSVATVGAGNAAEAYFTGTGKAPVLNLRIPEGYTPQKGLDYYTEEEREDLREAVADALRPEIITKFQQRPKFANSIQECTETDAVYVLPDGDIYAYMEAAVATYTNVIPASEALESTAVYNGVGYKDSSYISSGSGTDGTKAGHSTTGMITYPVRASVKPPVIYLKGGAPDRIAYYLSDKTYKMTINASAPTNFTIEQLGTGYWKISPMMTSNGNAVLYENQGTGGYLRFDCICDTGANLIIALDEEITESAGTAYQWTNTGHAFVPADYEDRIVILEESAAEHESRLLGLESFGDGVPAYVRQEAERVADLLLDKRNAQSICFAALSDIHYPYDDASDNVSTGQALHHAAMGLTEIRKILPLDFVGLFGDYVKGGTDSTVAESKSALKFIRKTMYEAGQGVRQIWMQGNHDRNPYDTDDGDLTDDELYAYIFSGNAGTVVDPENAHRGYGYQDFEPQKIRVIYLNSSDVSGAESVSDHMWSGAQLRWLANRALNFAEKPVPEEWGVVVLSHEPMNWGPVPAFTILDGYASGKSGSVTATEGENIPFDFSDAPRGEVICCVNGHTHNFRFSQTGENGIWQIAVPQVCAGRYNEYGTSWPDVGGEVDENGQPVYYYKTPESAQTTSFCVFLIDRKNRKIHALHYGAGIDREIDY